MTSTLVRRLPLLVLCAVVVAACAPKKVVKKAARTGSDTAAGSGMNDAGMAPGVETSEADIRGKEFVGTSDLPPVHFDYDAYGLSDEARATLRKNADYLKAHPDMEVLVAGHCDDRGTTEYNLALGQKRAKEVREYYLRLGVPGKTIGTISYGEESPVCEEAADACWHRNRRAETRVRSRTVSNGSRGFNPEAPQ